MPSEYDFFRQLEMSQGISDGHDIRTLLLDAIPGAVQAEQASNADDRIGIDWWVTLGNGKRLAVDLKVRAEDWANRGKDDLALETWSVVDRQVVGWTRDASKHCDRVLWVWQDTGRWCLIPFPELCDVFQVQWHRWAVSYGTWRQSTTRNGRRYQSECIFVPRKVVWRAIYNQYGGDPDRTPSRRTA